MTLPKKNIIVRIFFFALLISAVRVFSEITLQYYEFEGSPIQVLRFNLENTYFFLIGLFTIPALVSKFTKKEYPALLSLSAKFFPIIILAPWVDYFLTGRTAGYENAEFTPGIRLQIFLIVSVVVIYTFLKTRNFFRSGLAGTGTYLMMWFFAMPEFIFSPALNFSSDTFLQFYYFIPFLIGAFIFFKFNDADSFAALKKSWRPVRSLEGLTLALTAALVLYYSGYRVHQVHVLHAAVLVFLLRSVPREKMPLNASVVVCFVGLSYAFTFGLEAFFLSIIAFAVAFSGKNLNPLLKNLRGGAVAALSYFIALYAAAYVPFSMDAAVIGWGMFFFIGGAVLSGLEDNIVIRL